MDKETHNKANDISSEITSLQRIIKGRPSRDERLTKMVIGREAYEGGLVISYSDIPKEIQSTIIDLVFIEIELKMIKLQKEYDKL